MQLPQHYANYSNYQKKRKPIFGFTLLKAYLKLRLSGIQLLCKLGFFPCSGILMDNILCGSLVDLFHSQSDSSLGIVSFIHAGSVGSLENSSEVRSYSLVLHSFCSDNFNSFFCGFNIRHNVLLLNKFFFYGNNIF